MIKSSLIAFSIGLILLIFFLTPTRSHEFRAYPENLWTASGQWQQPSEKLELLRWKRVNYGYRWASWLVYDQGITESAWYVRIDGKYLFAYVVFSFIPAGIAFGIMEGLRRSGGEPSEGDNSE